MNKTVSLKKVVLWGIIFLILVVILHVCMFKINYGRTQKIVGQATTNMLYKRLKWVSVEGINKSLPAKHINVGFDIDDTVLFSSPCFYKLENSYVEKLNLKGKTEAEIWGIFMKTPSFWNEVAVCDTYSIPKKAAINVINMHLKRGDDVYFITARIAPTNSKDEAILNGVMKKLFNSNPKVHSVLYSNVKAKTDLIKKNQLSVYYGDADGDMIDAKAAGVREIRFLRASNSTLTPLPKLGAFGEEVLENSAD